MPNMFQSLNLRLCSSILVSTFIPQQLPVTNIIYSSVANSFTPWFKLIARDLLFPWWDEMLAKSRSAGWDEESGVGEVRADVLANGPKINELIRMI